MKAVQLDFSGSLHQPYLTCLALLFVLSGCADRSSPPHGPFGPAVSSRWLAPFQGAWKFDPEKTLELRQATGADDEELARLGAMYQATQQLNLDAGLTIRDNEALGSPFPFSEYRFFHLHAHDGTVCGKAWHHEDRFDPGDMSKCLVQLALVDGCLHFRDCMFEELDLDDPDLSSPLPVDLDSADKCEAETGNDWREWRVFVRAATK